MSKGGDKVKKAVVKRDSRSRKAAAKKEVRRWIIGMIILAFALLYFFPILYMLSLIHI